jgi:hypothetical protein
MPGKQGKGKSCSLLAFQTMYYAFDEEKHIYKNKPGKTDIKSFFSLVFFMKILLKIPKKIFLTLTKNSKGTIYMS